MENNKVLAKINGVEITEDVLNRTIEKFAADKRAYFESEFGRKQLLDQIINVELINAHGTETGIDQDDFYRTQMEQAEKDIRFNATMNRLMADVMVSDEEIQAKYDENPAAFSGPETIGARHILVDSLEQADQIKAKIDSNELSFEEAAKEFSSCPSKEAGGDLGSFGKGMMVPEFEEAAFASEINEVTAPVKTQFGYHLIQVYEKNSADLQSFDDVKDSIRTNLLQEKQMNKYTALIADLRDKYFDK
ncbi:peptidylprolyl isomerase [Clostridiaceae bacterium HFYG-1003]|nr:peptidylprolyl isomerase [Clostridiaceae bacterium HFYG-1003]